MSIIIIPGGGMLRLPRRSLGSIILKKLGSATLVTNDNPKNSTVDEEEVNFHGNLSRNWWNTNSETKALHTLNPLRIQLIRNGLANEGYVESDPCFPLKGIQILDVGCGGGILTEPLARLGGQVTGIDASPELIAIAQDHASLDPDAKTRLNFSCTTIEEFANDHSETYDALVTSEVLEHVRDKEMFLKCCTAVVKPGGSLFVTTINKTLLSWIGGIVVAEKLLNLLPVGTHDWEKFVSPVVVQQIFEACNCKTKLIHGLRYEPMKNQWSWSKCTSMNYAIHVRKL